MRVACSRCRPLVGVAQAGCGAARLTDLIVTFRACATARRCRCSAAALVDAVVRHRRRRARHQAGARGGRDVRVWFAVLRSRTCSHGSSQVTAINGMPAPPTSRRGCVTGMQLRGDTESRQTPETECVQSREVLPAWVRRLRLKGVCALLFSSLFQGERYIRELHGSAHDAGRSCGPVPAGRQQALRLQLARRHVCLTWLCWAYAVATMRLLQHQRRRGWCSGWASTASIAFAWLDSVSSLD